MIFLAKTVKLPELSFPFPVFAETRALQQEFQLIQRRRSQPPESGSLPAASASEWGHVKVFNDQNHFWNSNQFQTVLAAPGRRFGGDWRTENTGFTVLCLLLVGFSPPPFSFLAPSILHFPVLRCYLISHPNDCCDGFSKDSDSFTNSGLTLPSTPLQFPPEPALVGRFELIHGPGDIFVLINLLLFCIWDMCHSLSHTLGRCRRAHMVQRRNQLLRYP